MGGHASGSTAVNLLFVSDIFFLETDYHIAIIYDFLVEVRSSVYTSFVSDLVLAKSVAVGKN